MQWLKRYTDNNFDINIQYLHNTSIDDAIQHFFAYSQQKRQTDYLVCKKGSQGYIGT